MESIVAVAELLFACVRAKVDDLCGEDSAADREFIALGSFCQFELLVESNIICN